MYKLFYYQDKHLKYSEFSLLMKNFKEMGNGEYGIICGQHTQRNIYFLHVRTFAYRILIKFSAAETSSLLNLKNKFRYLHNQKIKMVEETIGPWSSRTETPL